MRNRGDCSGKMELVWEEFERFVGYALSYYHAHNMKIDTKEWIDGCETNGGAAS